MYTSNDTWKLEDVNGVPLYDDRYYSCCKLGDNFALSNENNEFCIINRNGNLLVDYGLIQITGDTFTYNGHTINDGDYFEGYDDICFIIIENGISSVYYYSD